jgi:hypothetical protein
VAALASRLEAVGTVILDPFTGCSSWDGSQVEYQWALDAIWDAEGRDREWHPPHVSAETSDATHPNDAADAGNAAEPAGDRRVSAETSDEVIWLDYLDRPWPSD